jgi:hypothetical protein
VQPTASLALPLLRVFFVRRLQNGAASCNKR